MSDVLVTSTANPAVKAARALRDRKRRRDRGEFLVTGGQSVGRAIEAGWQVHRVFLVPDQIRAVSLLNLVDRSGVPVTWVTQAVYGTLTEREGGEGIAAVVALPPPRALASVEGDFLLALADVGNPGNLGTVVRTADAAGAAAVVLLGECTDPYSPLAIKASMGSTFSVPVVAASEDELAAWAQRHNATIWAATGGGSIRLWEADLRAPTVLLMGPEGPGLSTATLERFASHITIPMTGTAESLNLSVAASVLAYEVVRQRSA